MTSHRITWTQSPALGLRTEPALREGWNRLNARGIDLPFMDADAICVALETFGSGDERVFVGRDGDAVVAMFVLRRSGAGRWETFQPSQMPLGAWLGEPGLPVELLASSLLRKALFPALALSVTQVDPRCAERPDDSPVTRVDSYIDTAWIDVDGSFDDYWAQRGKNLRANMRKQRNKLASDNVTAQLVAFEAPADMAAAVMRYGLLESSGWKAGGGTAIHPDNDQGRFYRGLLEQAAARGEAVVYEYRFGDKPVAMHLCLRRGGQLVILKTTYDESIDKSLSPALLLHQDELQAVFGAGTTRRVEYYGRVMEWHTRWTEKQRTIYHLTCYRWQWVKRLTQLRSRTPAADHAAAPTGTEPTSDRAKASAS